ncbi:MAG: hypothetical protein COU31_03540 [Candidatus Magasanikbacteria bacterium CG10_big_fil_rev_8_21_14_0_10_40_10]|uniref:DUF11 domain-containing protein n=1 Tax=Candidatus Magasanikbacteria bacterium CG10_big_fil_rev_8_21_14_0_10_40_10 TaxID=1974648 RepID=A0A2M6W3G8_9BACT|nr:MAG: hypothetical protein COU31_03540 [Candidatus Magasanikbacteria bacterium CG10_big_fil_rev_8_21_14_0_10_40_10]
MPIESSPEFKTKKIFQKTMAKPTAKKKRVGAVKKISPAKKSVKNSKLPPIDSLDINEPTTKEPVIKSPIKNLNFEKQLTSIYEDNSGNMPNMKRIKVKKERPMLKFFSGLIIIVGLLAAVAWAGFFILPNTANFSEDKVSLQIKGPAQITLGATTTYAITYENNQATQLENAVLNITYPKGFLFVSSSLKAKNIGHNEWDIGIIKPNEKKTITIIGFTYQNEKEAESWRVFLTYQPQKYNYKAQKIATLSVKLTEFPFGLTVTGPKEAQANSDVEYTYKLENKNKAKVGLVYVKPTLDKNFYISTSSPTLDKNGRWPVDTSTTTAKNSYSFTIKGRYANTTQKQADMGADLIIVLPSDQSQTYILAQTKTSTNLSADSLTLSLNINDKSADFSAQPGDALVFKLSFKNGSIEELKNAQLELKIDAPSADNRSVMDWSNITDKYDGDITGAQLSSDIRRGNINWDKNKITKLSELIPNDTVEIQVNLPIRDISQFDLTKLKNYLIEASATLTYQNSARETKSLVSNPIKITINSDLEFETRATKSTTTNGQTHSIQWVLTNNFHELKDIKLTADLYGQADWKLNGIAPAGLASFNSSTKKITWTIDKMPLTTVNVLALPFTVTIQNPNPSQETLVSKVSLQAQDTVTGQTIQLTGEEIKL